MTCREALEFSAKLRRRDSREAQAAIVNSISESLKLTVCSDTMIGDTQIGGLSGGEKKRTSVGVELVVEPSLIFLDEPTSGLDSFTALKTMEILKKMTADHDKQVIATIHQPSSEIFQMLDALLILTKGHVVYHGPTKNVVAYFDSLGYPCPKYTNPADYVVNRVLEDSEFFIEKWKKAQSQHIELDFTVYDTLVPIKGKSSSFCTQLTALVKREILVLFRHPLPSKIRFAQTILFALLSGTLYHQLPYTVEGQRNRYGAIYWVMSESALSSVSCTGLMFPQQRVLFEKERDANMYYTTTYLLAKTVAQLPEQTLFILLYLSISYWMVGFDSSFLEMYITLLLNAISVGSVGLIVGCFASNVSEAMQLMPIAYAPFALFTNFMVSLDQIPQWMRWMQWLDPFNYAVDSLSITEFRGQRHGCAVYQGVETCIYDGEAFLKQINAGYTDTYWIRQWMHTWMDSVHFNWICMGLIIVGFRSIVWIILVRRNGY